MDSRSNPVPSRPAGKYHIHTFGCQMNVNDSEYIAGLLSGLGLSPSPTPDDAALIIINTCSVRAKSEEKLFSLLGRLLPLKKKTGALLGLVGCTAQLQGDGLVERFAELDFIIGPDNYHRLPAMLTRNSEEACLALDRTPDWHEPLPRVFERESPVLGMVTVMEGCDNFCSYCVVPFARGREKYRPLDRILQEVEDLERKGYVEVDLLGQNVDSYRDPDTGRDLASLLAAVSEFKGIEWIRFITSHPKYFSRNLIRTMASQKAVCRQLHLPLQSGSSAVLSRMNRGYSREDYLRLVSELRDSIPTIALSTDIIVGFPGETERDFEETLTALDTIRFASIFSFRYSPRPLTAAAKLPDDVPPGVKTRRLIGVQALQKKIQTQLNRTAVGRVERVLGLGLSKKSPQAFSGRNEFGQVVNFTAPAQTACLGRFVDVLITGCGPYSLRGEVKA
jgi:tRNA-2-methylthio-N6-dimethylallyladenosine synthase